jgi:hypothetical protein
MCFGNQSMQRYLPSGRIYFSFHDIDFHATQSIFSRPFPVVLWLVQTPDQSFDRGGQLHIHYQSADHCHILSPMKFIVLTSIMMRVWYHTCTRVSHTNHTTKYQCSRTSTVLAYKYDTLYSSRVLSTIVHSPHYYLKH